MNRTPIAHPLATNLTLGVQCGGSQEWCQQGTGAMPARAKSRRVKTPNGAGSVTLRSDGRWMARYTTTDPDTGTAARKALYGHSEQEARAKLIHALADQGRGELTFIRGRMPTLKQFTDRWLKSKVQEVRPKTGQRYRELLEQYALPTLGPIQLNRLEPRHVDSLLQAKRAGGLAPKTCNHVRATLRACLNDAMRQGLVGRNVAALTRPLRLDIVRESVILTPEQVKKLMRLADRHRDGPLWIVALATGARQSELLGLLWADVDLTAKTISIDSTLQRMPKPLREEHGGWLEQPTKTRRSTRIVPLAQVAVEALRRQQAQQADHRRQAGTAWRGGYGDLVFTEADGTPLNGIYVTKRFQHALDDASIPVIRFHDLRHTAATFLALQKVPVAITMAVLGHANANTTLEVYTRVAPELAREAADAMDRVLADDG